MGGDGQAPGCRVVAAQRPGLLRRHRDTVPRLQPPGQRGAEVAVAEARREALGRAVDRVDVVVAIVEEVAHLLPRQHRVAGLLAAQRLVELRQPLLRLAMGAVEGEEGASESGRVRGDELHVAKRRRRRLEQRIGQRLAHVGDDAFGRPRRELDHVDPELLGEAEYDAGRHRPVVVLHLVEVGQRHPELCRVLGLLQPQAGADFPELDPGIELARRGHGFANLQFAASICKRVCKSTELLLHRGDPLITET